MVFLYRMILLCAVIVTSMSAHIDRYPQPIVRVGLRSNRDGWITISAQSPLVCQEVKKKSEQISSNVLITIRGKKVFCNGKSLSAGITKIYARDTHEPGIIINGRMCVGPIGIHITSHSVTIFAHCYRQERQLDEVWYASAANVADKKIAAKKNTHNVRVLIHEAAHNQKRVIWLFRSDGGFSLINPSNSGQKWYHPEKELIVMSDGKGLYINNTLCCHDQLHIIPKNGYSYVNQDVYHGSFVVMYEAKRNLLINIVDLEEYICGVLRIESWPGWPLEANKVMAVASRSYVMAMIKSARKQKLPYHVKNTNEHQNYRGMHNCMISRTATEETRGMFMSYNNEPVLAMFDACCGGIIPAHTENFNVKSTPYLARPYPCTHCNRCKVYSWETELSLETIGRSLGFTSKLKDIKISKKDRAGLVKELTCKVGDTTKIISGKTFYASLKDIHSFCFTMHKKSGKIVFRGRGYGHHVGLCQWGAREMVRDGWGYKQILQFYYPGIQFMRMSA